MRDRRRPQLLITFLKPFPTRASPAIPILYSIYYNHYYRYDMLRNSAIYFETSCSLCRGL